MIWFLVPTYNEAGNAQALADELRGTTLPEDRHYVFSDDGSVDGTVAELHRAFEGTGHTVLTAPTNQGPGAAFQRGFDHILAQASENDVVVTMEADRTSDITLLPKMLAISRLGYDMVLASVYVQGGGFEHTTFLRRLLSTVANFFFRFIYDLKVSTLSSFYRVYRVPKLQEASLRWPRLIEENGFICMLEVLLKMLAVRATVIEVPMVLASNKRTDRSKMKLVRTTLHYLLFLWRFRSGAMSARR